MSASCGSCGAPIVWAITEKGARMPLDAEPVLIPVGFTLVPNPDNPTADLARSATPVYRSHFASCPDAAQHRRRRAG